jgi:hypothetical protein
LRLVVAAEEDSAEEVSTGVVLEVEVSTAVDLEAEVSMGEVSVVGSTAAAFVVALWLPDMLAAESVAAVAESALAYRTVRVAFQTLLAQDPGSLHLVIHHPGNLSMMDDLIEP